MLDCSLELVDSRVTRLLAPQFVQFPPPLRYGRVELVALLLPEVELLLKAQRCLLVSLERSRWLLHVHVDLAVRHGLLLISLAFLASALGRSAAALVRLLLPVLATASIPLSIWVLVASVPLARHSAPGSRWRDPGVAVRHVGALEILLPEMLCLLGSSLRHERALCVPLQALLRKLLLQMLLVLWVHAMRVAAQKSQVSWSVLRKAHGLLNLERAVLVQ